MQQTLAVEEVPTTMHKSAFSTSSSIVSMCHGCSPNHTTPGRANEPHFEHRGKAFRSITGSGASLVKTSSVPDSAGQTGELRLSSV